MFSKEKPLFDWNQTFRAPNLASRESNKQENLTQFIQKVAPKAVQTEFAVLHAFERETTFWLKLDLQSSKSGISRIEWTTKFDTIQTRICSKNCSNWFCNVSCFRKINHFLTEIKPTELQPDTSRIKWRRKFDIIHPTFTPKTVQTEIAVRHTSEKEVTFWLKTNLQSSNLAFQESYASYAEDNLTQLIQENELDYYPTRRGV